MQRVQRCAGLQGLVTQLIRRPQASAALLQQLPCILADYSHQDGPSDVWSPGAICRQYATPAAFQAAVSNARPQSLALPKDTGELPDSDEIGGWRHFMLKLGGFYSRESAMQRGAKGLYETIVQQSEDNALKTALGLPDKFAATYSLLCLHTWMVLVRLRAEGQSGKDLAQVMYEDFTDDVEMRVHREGVKVRVSKWLKELEKMFYGGSESYERGLKGEMDMADALLRNVYGNDVTQRPHAVALAAYVKRELACLKMTPTSDVMGGKVVFSKLH